MSLELDLIKDAPATRRPTAKRHCQGCGTDEPVCAWSWLVNDAGEMWCPSCVVLFGTRL